MRRCNEVESQSERYLRAVIEHFRGVELERFDCDGRQRAVDYVFASPDGVLGAVEMTTYRDTRSAEMQSKWAKGATIICDSPRGWAVMVELGTKIDSLRNRLPPVIAACDRYGFDDPAQLPQDGVGEEIGWFALERLRLFPSGFSVPGTVSVHLPPAVGFPRDANLDHELEQMLTDALITSKLSKLRDHQGVTERHLAVGVGINGPGFDLMYQLISPREYIPDYAQPEDFAATHLWITAGFRPVLTWNRPGGWAWRSISPV